MRLRLIHEGLPQARWPFPLLLAGSGICCATILLFPWLVHWGAAQVAVPVWYLFSHLCHQELGRSLILGGVSLPVCSRCLALYLGGFLGVLFSPMGRNHSAWLLDHRALLLGPILLMGLDVGLDALGVWAHTLWSRAATGGLAGFGLGLYATLILERRSW